MTISNQRDESGIKHPIQVAARRSGLSPDVIRAWERRYGAVSPVRSANNRRLYSEEQIEKLRFLNRLLRSGHRIGDVARLSLDELRAVAAADTAATPAPPDADPAMLPPEGHLAACVRAVERLDADALEVALGRASVALSTPALIDHVLVPFLRIIGERWQAGTLRIAHEHLATAIVRSFLGNATATTVVHESAPELVVATPLGQKHELGALLVALAAVSDGWRVTYAGPGLPAQEIATLTQRRRAVAVALSILYPADDPRLDGELRTLGRSLDEETALLVGGPAAGGYADALDEIGARIIGDIETLRAELPAFRKRAGR